MDKDLLNAMAILDGEHHSYAYCSNSGEWHFHLVKKCFPRMKGQLGGYVISNPDALPLLTDQVPVMAIKLKNQKLLVYTKADVYLWAKKILLEVNDRVSLLTYRVDNETLSFLAIRILTMSTTVKPEDLAQMLLAEWILYPDDYRKLEK